MRLDDWNATSSGIQKNQKSSEESCFVLYSRQILPAPKLIEAKIRLDSRGAAGIVLNSDSRQGARYVVAVDKSRNTLRFFELPSVYKDWGMVSLKPTAKDCLLRIALLNEGGRSSLRVRVDNQVATFPLPTHMESFYEPALYCEDSVAKFLSLKISKEIDKPDWKDILTATSSDVSTKAPRSFCEPGEEEFLKWLETNMARVRDKYRLPAISCAVVIDDKIAAASALGVRRSDAPEEVTLGDQWHLGSNTKSMTCSLLGLYVQQGKLTWETPLGALLPELSASMHPQFGMMPLKWFLHNTSGLPDIGRIVTAGSSPAQMRTATVQGLLRQAPTFEPGSKHEYRNSNFVVGGCVVDRISGRSWEQAIVTDLFRSIGINSAGVGPMGLPGTTLQPLGHSRSGSTLTPKWKDNHPVLGPAGLVHMSILDFARYARFHLLGALGKETNLLKRAVFQELHRSYHDYGKGWGVGLYNDRVGALGHRGSNGFNSSLIDVNIMKRYAFVINANEDIFGNGGKALDELSETINREGEKRRG